MRGASIGKVLTKHGKAGGDLGKRDAFGSGISTLSMDDQPSPETAATNRSETAQPEESGGRETVVITPQEHHHGELGALTLGAIGVVYGDIGTSPLYALKECLSPHHGLTPSRENVLGLLSLMTWSLLMVVTFKYLAFIMRAENRGQGGILALLALLPERFRVAGIGRVTLVTTLVVFGAGLLYGDGIITPAISVLSAVEGLGVATHELDRFVVPITCGILFGLFAIQRYGTARVGVLFGPVMVLWFVVLAAMGVVHIVQNPSVLWSLSPHYAVQFLMGHGFIGFAVLGSVVLCVTGGEALYADMGHFGARPIRVAWLFVVMPALLLAYMGQGANVIAHPEAADNPFYAMVPEGPMTYALVGLATLATVIASQALITGAFSLTHQAVQLGIFPRVTVRHTSGQSEGQIYLPEVNWTLCVLCLLLVLGFQSSSGLAAAYGIAVCGTMAITSIAFALVARERWGWPTHQWLPLLAVFLLFDLGFLGANLLKFMHGGYVPVLIALVITAAMIIWIIGRSNLGAYYASRSPSWDTFKQSLADQKVVRPDAVGVFMASDARGVPPMMVHQAERIKAMPETVLLVTVRFEHVPWIPPSERLAEVTDLGQGFYRVIARYGFMQQPRVTRVVHVASQRLGLKFNASSVTYYLGRESFVASKNGRMGPVLESLFAALSRNAMPATAYFRLPPSQVVELGIQIDL